MTVIRPSKVFLFERLKLVLRRAEGAVGIDAASANFKNRRMFHTQKYFGIDIDLPALLAGVQKHPGTFGIHGDLRDLRALLSNSADAVVSTNTLHQLPAVDRIRAASELARLTAPAGVLFLELPIDAVLPAILGNLRRQFFAVKVYYYKNPVSRAYERLFEREGELGSHPVAGTRPMRFLSWLLSRSEYLTCRFPSGNRHAFIVCGKKTSAAAGRFDLSAIPLKEERIYDIISE